MITTSTSTEKLNCLNQQTDDLSSGNFNDLDLMFYDSLRPQLEQLKKSPDDETISRILAYSAGL